jgi:protein-tyrosine phosphatase
MRSILIVCTANQCRSPLAAALLRRRLAEQGMVDWQVDSAGTWAAPNRPADQRAHTVAAKVDLDLSNHRARCVDEAMLAAHDLILTMERGQQEALRLEFPIYAARIRLFSELGGFRYDIRDPVTGTLGDFHALLRELDRLIQEGLPRIRAGDLFDEGSTAQ